MAYISRFGDDAMSGNSFYCPIGTVSQAINLYKNCYICAENVLVMQTTKEILEQLRVYKAAKADVYGIETLGLFGSAARGEQQEDSDIDVCVKLKKADFFKRMSIQEDLESIFSRKVDVVSLGAIMRPFFKKTLERDAIFV